MRVEGQWFAIAGRTPSGRGVEGKVGVEGGRTCGGCALYKQVDVGSEG